MKFSTAATLALIAAAGPLTVDAASGDGTCQKFHQIYDDGADLCNSIFSTSFKYVAKTDPDYDKAYTMWWFDSDSPNDATTQIRRDAGLHSDWNVYNTTQCHLKGYNHKDVPSPEEDDFNECHPWKDNACCKDTTVDTHTAIRDLYGPEWRWDRCGQLSQACERFFVAEGCAYECDPNFGLFRRFKPTLPNPENGWELFQMPIKGDFCDAWYTACFNDKFCAEGGGDFFSCAASAETTPTPSPTSGGLGNSNDGATEPLSSGTKWVISIFSILGVFMIGWIALVIYKEKKGTPMFAATMAGEGLEGGAKQAYDDEGLFVEEAAAPGEKTDDVAAI